MKYVIKPRAARKIYTFYGNVAKKYRHTYDKADYKRNVHDALMSIYNIEGTFLRREPKLKRWAKYLTNILQIYLSTLNFQLTLNSNP